MDFSKALTYPFDDPDWAKKLGIGAGIGLVVFVIVFGLSFFAGVFPPAALCTIFGFVFLVPLIGWSIETTKRVRDNVPNPMASWDDFGGLTRKGLTPFLAYLVYQIPLLLAVCVIMAVVILPFLGVSFLDTDSDAAGGIFAGIMGVAGIGVICVACLMAAYGIAASIVYWGGLMRYLDKEEFSTFMQFGENFALVRNNSGDFVMAYLLTLVGGFIASLIGSAVPCIGWAAVFPFQFYFNSHIMGQLAAKIGGTAAPKPMM